MSEMNDTIAKEVLANSIENKKSQVEGEEEFDIEGEKIWIGVKRAYKQVSV
jgi:hypothetical protein